MDGCPALEAGEDRSTSPGSEAPDGWVMYFDGAFVQQGAGAGAVLVSPTQDKLYYAVQLCFQRDEKVSNNIAEYEGLIAGLKAAAALGVKRLRVRGDSQLFVNFSIKVYEPKDEHMEAYLAQVRKMEKQFLGLELQHVPRGTNKEADDIARRASKRQPQEPGVFEERLFKPSATSPLSRSAVSGGAPAASYHGSPSQWPGFGSASTRGARALGGMLDQGIQGIPDTRGVAREGGGRGTRGPSGHDILHPGR